MKMANWLERARHEIPKSARRRTANSAKRTLTAVMAVPNPGLWKNRRLLSAVMAVPHRGVSRKSRRRCTGYEMHAATRMAIGRQVLGTDPVDLGAGLILLRGQAR
jgi:hypothetical protein